jgi:hypothetical protein
VVRPPRFPVPGPGSGFPVDCIVGGDPGVKPGIADVSHLVGWLGADGRMTGVRKGRASGSLPTAMLSGTTLVGILPKYHRIVVAVSWLGQPGGPGGALLIM